MASGHKKSPPARTSPPRTRRKAGASRVRTRRTVTERLHPRHRTRGTRCTRPRFQSSVHVARRREKCLLLPLPLPLHHHHLPHDDDVRSSSSSRKVFPFAFFPFFSRRVFRSSFVSRGLLLLLLFGGTNLLLYFTSFVLLIRSLGTRSCTSGIAKCRRRRRRFLLLSNCCCAALLFVVLPRRFRPSLYAFVAEPVDASVNVASCLSSRRSRHTAHHVKVVEVVVVLSSSSSSTVFCRRCLLVVDGDDEDVVVIERRTTSIYIYVCISKARFENGG